MTDLEQELDQQLQTILANFEAAILTPSRKTGRKWAIDQIEAYISTHYTRNKKPISPEQYDKFIHGMLEKQ